jgi:2,4-dienoyl-CoA reductase-like NADH-dependent reductase (Old Yellow Enzyme family)
MSEQSLTSHVSTPLQLRELTLPNRIMMSPMCQHRATADAAANDWHLVHYGSRALGGVGLIMIEDCAVSHEGRLSEQSLGLYADTQITPLRRIVDLCHSVGAKVGIQLGHAGRKAFGKGGPPPELSIIGATGERFADSWTTPRQMTEADEQRIIDAFGQAAERAVRAGLDVVEVHAAHGYLLHESLSAQETSGNLGGAVRENSFLNGVVRAVRDACPETVAVFARISVGGLAEGDLSLTDGCALAQHLRELGVDLIDVSSGGLTSSPVGNQTPNQPDVCAELRAKTGLPTIGVGGVVHIDQAEAMLADGRCDLVAVGRALLENPYWAKDLLVAR